MGQPVGPIEVKAPIPSILTSARDRTQDDFGTSAPVTGDLTSPGDGALTPMKASWRNGLSWTPASCATTKPWLWCPENGDEKDEAEGLTGVVDVAPFVIYTPLDCEWVTKPESINQAAMALTEAHTAWGIARALWLGEGLPDEPTQPTLRRSATDVSVGGVAADLDDAVALLLGAYETATGGNGGATLHIPSIFFTGALGGVPGGSLIARLEGNLYRGPLGSVMSPGPGYPWGASAQGADGYGPLIAPGPPEVYAGNPADEAWIYVSGPVEYAVGPVEAFTPTDGTNLRRNTHEVIAERPAIVRFDPCSVFAARAYMTVTVEGS